MSRIITAAHLESAGAYAEQVERFRELFGEFVTVTTELCVEYASDIDFYFAARHFLSPAAQAEFDRADDAALAEYDRANDAALAEYDRANDAAQAEYDRVCDAALAEYDRANDAARAEYDRVCDATRAEYDRVCAVTFAELYNRE